MSPKEKIYLDNNATTKLDKKVLEVITQDLQKPPSNPSCMHYYGRDAKKRLLEARDNISSFFNVKPNEIIFTSGGTESINMTLRGIFGLNPKGHIITTDLDHSCVFNTVRDLSLNGCEATYISPGLFGAPTVEQISQAIKEDTKVIIISAVNSETGVKADIEKIAQLARENNIPLIVDGVALLAKEIFSIPEGVSAMCFSSHKIHGPKGVGLAFIRSDLKLSQLITGGGQEYSRRAGTENLSGILGFAKAIDLINDHLPEATSKMKKLRDHFESEITLNIKDVIINGEGPRICNTSNLAFKGIEGSTLLMKLDMAGICASQGSACTSGTLSPSRILLNMGIPPEIAASSIRFSISRETTKEALNKAIEIIIETANKLKKAK